MRTPLPTVLAGAFEMIQGMKLVLDFGYIYNEITRADFQKRLKQVTGRVWYVLRKARETEGALLPQARKAAGILSGLVLKGLPEGELGEYKEDFGRAVDLLRAQFITFHC